MNSLPRQYLVLGAAAAAVATLVVAVLPLARHLSDYRRPLASDVPATQAPPASSLASPILAWEPFGKPEPPPAAEQSSEGAPDLMLTGVVIATRQNASRASLSGTGMPQRSFAVGEEVAPGVTLTEIHPDHVVLTVEGQQEVLGFPTVDDLAAPAPNAQPGQTQAVGK